ncbi:MAG TPA: chemotaxis protein CheW [Gammaproteobacteria bacterium]|nr:chemotaxis protein CheW [Gammaproteobacteria bacterium]
MSKKDTATVVDQKLALGLFLDALLREPEVETVTETETEVAEARPAEVVHEMPAETPVEIPEETPAEIAVPVAEEAAPTAILAPDYRPPEWADAPFQALLFHAGGLTLAVPLIELAGVLEWPEELTAMPGHADFYLGLARYLENNVPVVDTARLVLPDKVLVRLPADPLERVTRIVLIDEGRWGLACDSVGEVITLQPGAVRWRETRPSRPWIAGTLVDEMCALLDSAVFAARLGEGFD